MAARYKHPDCTCESLPKITSNWKRCQLETIGISYSPCASSLSHLMSLLKKHTKFCELPDICQRLIEFTKQVFDLSLRFDCEADDLWHLLDRIERLCAGFKDNVREFKQQNYDLLQDEGNESIFHTWQCHLNEFFSYLKIFTIRWIKEDIRKGSFTQLLMHFSKTCLQRPEIGNALVETLPMYGGIVTATPAIRYPSYEVVRKGVVEIVTMAEVKENKECSGEFTDDSFTVNNLSESVLGQHGIELVIQRKSSFFRTAVSGLICVGTKIIFTVLEMETDPFKRIQEDKISDHQMCSVIRYSRPYDFLEASDRNEILDLCFWLGYVQSSGYNL